MKPNELFLRSLDDLHFSINSNDAYEIIRASAILRQLFLDGQSSLVDKVNREYKIKLSFKIIKQSILNVVDDLKPDFFCVIDGIDPRNSRSLVNLTDLNRDSFFKLKLGCVHGKYYSVTDVIKYTANNVGGVHAGNTENNDEEIMQKLKGLCIYSELSVLLQHLRSIGRIVLEGLRPLRDKVLNLVRFEGAPGMSVHIALKIQPIETEQALFIFDVGAEENRDRISIYIDTHEELCFRFIDCLGHTNIVKAGSHDCAFRYGITTYLNFQIAFIEDEVLLHLDTGGWSIVEIISRKKILQVPDQKYFVMASDVTGKAHTHMHLMELCIYSRYLKAIESVGLRKYFERRIRNGYKKSIYMKGRSPFHSSEHPNFSKVAR